MRCFLCRCILPITRWTPKGETGKTEAWIVLDAGRRSRIYTGLKAGTTAQDLRELSKQTVDNCLATLRIAVRAF